jgi:hypothetical protein
MITKIRNILSTEDCLKISDIIKTIPEENFTPQMRVKILGNTLYQFKNFNEYSKASIQTNKLLKTNFSFMYDKVLFNLSKELNCQVEYNDHLSLPGFQIYSYDDVHNKMPARKWHYDDEKLGFPIRPVDYDVTLTILIENPGKVTYDYFPCTHSLYSENKTYVCEQHVHLSCNVECQNPNCKLTDDKIQRIEYDVGMMIITKDRYLHRIGPTDFYDKSKQRITLQGHGYFKNNKLYLHW